MCIFFILVFIFEFIFVCMLGLPKDLLGCVS